jgi:hypothetical protein
MTDLIVKYSLLNKTAQKEVIDFLDFLLSKQKSHKTNMDYKIKINSVSTWSDSDLAVFRNNQKLFNQWRVEEW